VLVKKKGSMAQVTIDAVCFFFLMWSVRKKRNRIRV